MGTVVAIKQPIYARDYLFGEGAEVFSGQMTVIGTLLHGQTALAGYFHPPRYRAFRFAAGQDDRMDIWVRSNDGDAVAWLLDTNFNTLAWNDDAQAGITDAHIVLTIPSIQPVFYIVFREYKLAFSHFSVQLQWLGRDNPERAADGTLPADLRAR
jgi:hypothetical protein